MIRRLIFALINAVADEVNVRDGIVYVYMSDGSVWTFTEPKEEVPCTR